MSHYMQKRNKFIEIKDYEEAFKKFKNETESLKEKDNNYAEKLEDLKDNIDFLREKDKEEIMTLQKKISKLEESIFSEKEKNQLKQQIRLLEEQCCYGFPITSEEYSKIFDWQHIHVERKNNPNDENYSKFIYEFVPSKNGTDGICRCTLCNERFIFKRYNRTF